MKPSASLDLSKFDRADRVDAWRYFSGILFDVMPSQADDNGPDARLNCYRAGQGVFGEYNHRGNYVRNVESCSKVEKNEIFLVCAHLTGVFEGMANDSPMRASTTEVSFYDLHQKLAGTNSPMRCINFLFPYSEVGYDPSLHENFRTISTKSPVGQLLRSNLELMGELMPGATSVEADTIASAFTGLLKVVITGDTRDEKARAGFIQCRNTVARRYIAEHLRDLSLSIEQITRDTGISAATLHGIYRSQGGVNNAITRLRLEGAMQDLKYAEAERGAISRISKKWAFTDQPRFNRLFKDTFGTKPSDILGSLGRAPSPLESPGEKMTPDRNMRHYGDLFYEAV